VHRNRSALPLSIAALCALLGLAGCRSEPTELQPANEPTAGAENEPADAPVAEADDDVHVSIRPEGWLGWDAIQRYVTPMHVTVNNQGDTPVLVRYESFVVRGAGATYRAVPPWQMDQEAQGFVARHTYAPIEDPLATWSGYQLAPPYSPVYPSDTVVRSQGFSSNYYAGFEGYWTEAELPTEEMLRRVIPEGLLAPGGQVDGVIFFEHVPEDATGLELHVELATEGAPDAPDAYARMTIPLVVQNEADES